MARKRKAKRRKAWPCPWCVRTKVRCKSRNFCEGSGAPDRADVITALANASPFPVRLGEGFSLRLGHVWLKYWFGAGWWMLMVTKRFGGGNGHWQEGENAVCPRCVAVEGNFSRMRRVRGQEW